MVNYSCSNCQKIFKQKGHYDFHMNRKTPCKKDNTIEKLVEEKVQNALKQKFDIFTPDLISRELSTHFPERVKTLLEPSIGTGNLLKYVKFDKCIAYDINKNYTDQIKYRVEIRNEDFLLAEVSEKFDGVIMNPPYLRFQEMKEETREYIAAKFPDLSSGNVDLYLAFVMKAFECLNDHGVLVAIIPASYLYNVSCKRFRKFILSNKYLKYVKNFEDLKVFSDADVYCSILVLTKAPNDTYMYETLSTKTTKTHDHEIISETGGVSFESYCKKITNGIATLADKVFIKNDKMFEEPCWKPIYKISTQQTQWILYPYSEDGIILSEDDFKTKNPQSYKYLLENRSVLENRDKGKKKYKAWYAFGREQSVKIPTEKCIFIPTMSSESLDKICIKEPMLFYSGICVIPNINAEHLLEKIIQSKSNLINLCSKRSGKWINITVGVLRMFKVT